MNIFESFSVRIQNNCSALDQELAPITMCCCWLVPTPQSYHHLAHTFNCSASFGSFYGFSCSASAVHSLHGNGCAAQLMVRFDLGLRFLNRGENYEERRLCCDGIAMVSLVPSTDFGSSFWMSRC